VDSMELCLTATEVDSVATGVDSEASVLASVAWEDIEVDFIAEPQK